MIVTRVLLLMIGVIAVLVGSQLAWGQVTDDLGFTIGLTFFLDLAAIGTILGAAGAVLGFLGLSDTVSRRAAGALMAIFGVAIAAGALVTMFLIDGAELALAPSTFEIPPALVEVGPAGIVVAAGGFTIFMAGLLVIESRLPSGPPIPSGGQIGETPPGWYAATGGDGLLYYWTGSRWTHSRRG